MLQRAVDHAVQEHGLFTGLPRAWHPATKPLQAVAHDLNTHA
jgi:hypothetical protein